MGTGPCRRTAPLGLAVLVTGLVVLVPATPAPAAPPPCTTTPPAGRVLPDVPWAQQWYAPERLTGLADGTGVQVAVIDSGVDGAQPQLRHRLVPGKDLLDGGDGTRDCVGHGTAVASIIAAAPQPGVGFRGLAPGATLVPFRVTDQVEGAASGRAGTAAGFATAIRQAVAAHAKVLNVSIVLYRDDPAVRDAVAYALASDVVVVAAAGNAHGQGDPVPYPAAYDGVIGVGAIGPDGQRWPDSQVGPYVDLVAPGSAVTAATVGDGCAVGFEGTSFAVPFVAATAALVRQYSPALRARDVAARLLATADPTPDGPDSRAYGHGVLNPYRAVTDVVASPAPPQAAQPIRAARATPANATARRARADALVIAAAGVALTATFALVASALARGRRRQWRPGTPDATT
jgi:membrane-anchored mycosin MYCP